jgi:hypothetical protein
MLGDINPLADNLWYVEVIMLDFMKDFDRTNDLV